MLFFIFLNTYVRDRSMLIQVNNLKLLNIIAEVKRHCVSLTREFILYETKNLNIKSQTIFKKLRFPLPTDLRNGSRLDSSLDYFILNPLSYCKYLSNTSRISLFPQCLILPSTKKLRTYNINKFLIKTDLVLNVEYLLLVNS